MLYFIPTPIGNLGDITCRALDVLQACELVLCEDVRVCKTLLFKLSEKYKLDFKANCFISLHSHNEADFDFSKIDFSKEIVYMSDAGMPCISDPGIHLVKYAKLNNIDYTVLPGSNAALTALVSSALSEKEFLFLGFLNIKKNRLSQIENALNHTCAVILYEAPTRIYELICDIAKIQPDREIFVIKEISKLYEQKFYGTASNLKNILKTSNLKGEWVVVISPNIQENSSKIIAKDILDLEISPKIKAKLLSKINGLGVKENYEKIIKEIEK